MAKKPQRGRPRARQLPPPGKKYDIPPGATKKASDADLRPGEPPSSFDDRYAAGTPGGGTEYGGLAGSNFGDGDPEVPELNDAMANGIHEPEEVESEETVEAYGGPSGGAVGGTPAGKRVRGGQMARRGLKPHDERRGDSTIGHDPVADSR
jgi:hypothetical protein